MRLIVFLILDKNRKGFYYYDYYKLKIYIKLVFKEIILMIFLFKVRAFIVRNRPKKNIIYDNDTRNME